MVYLRRFTPLNICLLLLTLILCFLGSKQEKRQYTAPPKNALSHTDGRLTVYSPGRGETLFEVYLQGNGVGMCCIIFDGFYPTLKRYEGKLSRIYWSYVEGLDRKVGFEIYLIDDSGAEIKKIKRL